MQTPQAPWDKQFQFILLLTVGLNLVPHVLDLPIWISLACAVMLGWKWLTLQEHLRPPARSVLWLLTLLGSGAIFAEYKTLFGLEPASALLAFVSSAKLLETNRYRDGMFVIFTAFFLLMAHLLHSQTLLSTAFMVADLVLITALMFQIHQRGRRSLASLRSVARFAILTVPLTVFIFTVFPRFQTRLAQLTAPPPSTVGFSDQIDPGSVAQIALDTSPAFRVVFESRASSRPPRVEQLYWRGEVLTYSNGLSWRPLAPGVARPEKVAVGFDLPGQPKPGGRDLVYDVYLEPIAGRTLFLLEDPKALASASQNRLGGVVTTSGSTFKTKRPLVNRAHYTAESRLSQGVEEGSAPLSSTLSAGERAANLQLPTNLSPRVQTLASELEKGSASALEKSDRVLDWFRVQKFRYSLSPGVLKTGKIDEFLFGTRVGFCEHFAASFAVLMRAMHVPARVVVGYQGGDFNRIGDYILVRNQDAHAWAEIWVESPAPSHERGYWKRVDPTEVVAPLRIALGADFFSMNSSLNLAAITAEDFERQLSPTDRLLRRTLFAWDATQMAWNSFLLRYDFNYQKALAEALGLSEASRFEFFIGLGFGLIVFAVAMSWWQARRGRKRDPVLQAWHRFCAKLSRIGIDRAPHEGPRAFADRVAALRPDVADEVQRIAATFISLRYASDTSGERGVLLHELQKAVRCFTVSEPSHRISSQS